MFQLKLGLSVSLILNYNERCYSVPQSLNMNMVPLILSYKHGDGEVLGIMIALLSLMGDLRKSRRT